ncbi:hypothetical protein Tco_0317407 [Tanacetum coccineum]
MSAKLVMAVGNAKRAAEVKRDLENDAEENDIRFKELFCESPSEEVIEKARKEIFGMSLDQQVFLLNIQKRSLFLLHPPPHRTRNA